MFGRLRAAPRLIAFAGFVVLLGGTPAAAGPAALACAGLSSLSAVVDVLRENGIDPFVAAPGGADPVSVAVIPEDSEAAEAAAQAFQLRRLEPAGEGESRETTILPRMRPSREEVTTSEAKPVTTVKPTPGAATSAVYRSFIAGLSTLAKLRLDQPQNLARAKALLVKSDLVSLARAWLARCAEIASQSQAFVDGVEKAAGAGGADQLNSNIERQPSSVMNIGGWQSASLAIRQEMAKDIRLMQSVSFRLSEISYGRSGGEAHFAEEANKGDLTSAAPAGSPSPASLSPTLGERAKPLMTQMLALGAHMHLAEQASKPEPDPTATMLETNKDNDQCMKWAQLNLDQCMAAARDNSERAYCLGKQGIDERVKCWSVLLGAAS
jgi:hypothetical protein